MSSAIVERNLFALMRVNEPLARALVDYGGPSASVIEPEDLELPDLSKGQHLHLAGVVAPTKLHQWCNECGSVTLYCDRIEELLFVLSLEDFRQPIFSGSFVPVLGAWRFAIIGGSGERLRATPSYERSASWAQRAASLLERPKVIVANGGLFVDDVGEAFVALNFCPYLVELEDLPIELWPSQNEVVAELVFSVNDRRGIEVFAKSLEAKGLVWQIDPDLNEDRVKIANNLFIGWYRPLSQAEPQRRYLPLAANPKRRSARTEPCSGVSFVGSSMQATGLEYRRCFEEHLCSLGVGEHDAQERVQDFCEQICSEQDTYSRELALEVFPELGSGITKMPTQELGVDTTIWLGEYLAWQWRLSVVKNLSVPLELWGDEGWRGIENPRIHFHGECGHGEALSKVYGETLINLDIGRVYQQEIVTMRVFDVLASKRFILTPHTPALSQMFAIDREIVTYKSLEELNQKIRYYLAHPQKAEAIADAGYRRVLKDHQIVQRLESLVSWANS